MSMEMIEEEEEEEYWWWWWRRWWCPLALKQSHSISGSSTELSAKATTAKTKASATGETLIPADQSTIVITATWTLEPMAL